MPGRRVDTLASFTTQAERQGWLWLTKEMWVAMAPERYEEGIIKGTIQVKTSRAIIEAARDEIASYREVCKEELSKLEDRHAILRQELLMADQMLKGIDIALSEQPDFQPRGSIYAWQQDAQSRS